MTSARATDLLRLRLRTERDLELRCRHGKTQGIEESGAAASAAAVYWDDGDGTPSWPCGWCAGYCERDDSGEIVDSESSGLPGTDSGDEGERTAYTDEQLVALAVEAHGPAWADATVRR